MQFVRHVRVNLRRTAEEQKNKPYFITFKLNTHSRQSLAWVWGSVSSWVWGSVSSWVWGSVSSWVWGSVSSWAWGSVSSWAWGSVSSWVWGSVSSWVWGSVPSWVWGSVPSWVWGSVSSYLRLPPPFDGHEWSAAPVLLAYVSGYFRITGGGESMAAQSVKLSLTVPINAEHQAGQVVSTNFPVWPGREPNPAFQLQLVTRAQPIVSFCAGHFWSDFFSPKKVLLAHRPSCFDGT